MGVKDINTTDWSLSLRKQGRTVDGVFDIHQSIYIILTTIKGSDPFRPNFGCDIYSRLDKNINSALPSMISDIVVALGIWEQRITVVAVRPEIVSMSNVKFQIEWKLTDSAITQIYDFELFLNGSKGFDSFKFLSSESADFLTTQSGKKLVLDYKDDDYRQVLTTSDFIRLGTEDGKTFLLK